MGTWAEEEKQRIAVEKFAKERGWIVAKHSFCLDQLRRRSPIKRYDDYVFNPVWFDHTEYFKDNKPPYRPAAFVIHLYPHRLVDVQQYADKDRVSIEQLPYSWYLPGPGGTIAFVVTP